MIYPVPFKVEQKADNFMEEGSGENGIFKEKAAGCWRKSVNLGDWKGASIDKIY